MAVAGLLLAGAAHADEAAADDAGAGIAHRATVAPTCADGRCSYRLSTQQLLSLAERLVVEKKYEEARPLVAALAAAPGMKLQYNFLDGMIAMHTGDPETATGRFRAILSDDPKQTRVRLELARALMMQGKFGDADYHLRLAQNDESLPEDIARMIGNARSVIRSNRRFRFGFDVGVAPDTNINSATAAQSIDVNLGGFQLPLDLDENARRRSGVGLTASAYASMRLPATAKVAIVGQVDTQMVNYQGGNLDDYTVQASAGPEFAIGQRTSVSVEGVGLFRWFGGTVASRQAGAKITAQHTIGRDRRVALQVDGRRNDSDLNSGYKGWQLSGNATFEQVVAKSAIASASVYARREILKFDAYSNTVVGVNVGIGGELPLGINAGVSGGVSRARYDEAQTFFSDARRKDWRLQGRAYAGLRQLRFLNLSPSVEYSYVRNQSNYAFYKTDRHRVEFKLARYF